MRKLVGALAAIAVLVSAGSAIAGQGATNANGDFADLSVKVTPPISSTAKVKHGVGVTFYSFEGNRINANRTFNNTGLFVHFSQNFVDNGLLFPACTLNPKGLSVCAANTKVGTGTAEGELLSSSGGAPTYVSATLTAYNGKPYLTKSPTEIITVALAGKPIGEYDFRLYPDHGGLTLSQIQFPAGSGPIVYLTKFNIIQPDRSETRKVNGKTVKIHILQAPTVCQGSWTFSQTFTYATQAPLTATDSQPCIKG